MNERLLVDTDIVDYLRDVSQAVDYLEQRTGVLLLSSITVAELFASVREGKERTALQALLSAFEVVPVDMEIAERGGPYRRDLGRSHGVGLADALIAATATLRQAEVATLNVRHFPMFPTLVAPYRRSSES